MAALMAAILRFLALALAALLLVHVHLRVANAFLDVALGLVPLAAKLRRLVAAELAGLFLDRALGLVALAFDLVLHRTSFGRPRSRTSPKGAAGRVPPALRHSAPPPPPYRPPNSP